MRDKRVIKAIAMITQVSISMMVPIFLCIFIGIKIDKFCGTSFWFLIFLGLGFVTSIRNVYYLTKNFYAKDKAREDAEMNYFRNLRQNNLEKNINKSDVRNRTKDRVSKDKK